MRRLVTVGTGLRQTSRTLKNHGILPRNAVDLGTVRRWAEPEFVGVLFKEDPERILEHLREEGWRDEPLDDRKGDRSLA